MKNAGLRGPRPESFHILSRAHRDRDILVPRNLPIRLWDFVEEDATNSECLLSKDRLSQFMHKCRFRQFSDLRKIQKIAHCKDLAAPDQFFPVLLPLKGFD